MIHNYSRCLSISNVTRSKSMQFYFFFFFFFFFFLLLIWNYHTGYAAIEKDLTIDERGSKIVRNGVFDFHLSPYWRQSKTLFLTIFDLRSSIVLTFLIAAYPV